MTIFFQDTLTDSNVNITSHVGEVNASWSSGTLVNVDATGLYTTSTSERTAAASGGPVPDSASIELSITVKGPVNTTDAWRKKVRFVASGQAPLGLTVRYVAGVTYVDIEAAAATNIYSDAGTPSTWSGIEKTVRLVVQTNGDVEVFLDNVSIYTGSGYTIPVGGLIEVKTLHFGPAANAIVYLTDITATSTPAVGGFGDVAIPLQISTSQSGDLNIPVQVGVITVMDLASANLHIPLRVLVSNFGDVSIPLSVSTGYPSGDAAIPLQVHTTSFGDAAIPLAVIVAGDSQHWRTRVLLGGVDVSARITGEVTVEAAEASARIADFVLVPAAGPINPYAWVGQLVVIEHVVVESNGEIAQRLFTGRAHLPEYSVNDGTVRFTCTDDLQNRIAALPRTSIDLLTGGRYAEGVQGTIDDNWAYSQARMETVAGSLDAAPNGALRVTPWDGLAVWRTYDLTNTLDGSIDFIAPQRTGLVNKINATFEYRFNRLHRATANIRYAIDLVPTVVNNMLPLLSRSTVEAALEATGWEFYTDGGINAGGSGGGGGIFAGGEPLKRLINYTPYPSVYHFPPPSVMSWIQNESDTTCLEFSCEMYKRWAQTVTETTTLTVQAPESIAQNGEIVRDERGNLASEWDAGAWEADLSAAPQLGASGNTQVLDYAPDATPEDRDAAIQTLVDLCRVQILASHRGGRGKASTWLDPALDLDKRIRIAHPTKGTGEGKVVLVRHRADMNTGEAVTEFEIAPSGHGAIGLPEVIPTPVVAPPAPPVVTVSSDWRSSLDKVLTAHVGGLASSPDFDPEWEGWIVNVQGGFSVDDPGSTAPVLNPETQKTERVLVNSPYSGSTSNPAYVAAKAYAATGFRLVLPAVEDAARSAAAPTTSATYDIPIPADEFSLAA